MNLNHQSIPQVALEFMNRDHAEFALLRAKLLDLLAAKAPPDRLQGALEELVEHTRRHFAAEERAMQECGFPVYAVHKADHDTVLADMAARAERWKRDRDDAALCAWLDGEVGEWFLNHVGSMDFVTAKFIDGQGRRS
jgi:hemerythrin